jgi:hypothetical protein
MKRSAVLVLIAVLGCTTTTSQQQKQAAKSEFQNLQVLPKDIPREQLLAAMRGFTRGLGVRCNHCHVVKETTPKEVLDFPSDAKDEKRNARVMLRMTMDINRRWIPLVDEKATPEESRVNCWTCHRGKPLPEAPPPPQPPAQQAQPHP